MDLNIDTVCAESAQAKGRIERVFSTLQDRMVKELRLAGISTVAAANAWRGDLMAGWNARFGRRPTNANDLHRPLTAADKLEEILKLARGESGGAPLVATRREFLYRDYCGAATLDWVTLLAGCIQRRADPS